jgi:hypothetical protein
MLLTGCNLGKSSATPTQGLNATQSFGTAVARVTQFYQETQAASGDGPTLTPTPEGPSETPEAGTPSATPQPTSAATQTPEPCDRVGAGSPIDVTIEDGTEMLPGQAFVKTWRLVNTGNCTWTTSYAVVWVSGEEMGDSNVVSLASSVGPGQTADLSVPMTAPTEPGSYQSNWQLRNADGVLFGIGADGNGIFWAQIEVVSPTATPTATATATATAIPSATATPEIQVNGTVNLPLDNTLNLDNLALNSGAGDDLAYAQAGGGEHELSLLNGAAMGVFGSSKPGLANCQATGLGAGPLTIEGIGVGIFVCYQTDAGLLGWFQVSAFDENTGTVTLILVTWAAP